MTSSIGGLGSSSALYEKLFTKLDADKSGSVSRDEFVAGAPEDVSSEQAGALYDQLDSSGSGSLSKSDLATAFEQMSSETQAAMIQIQGGGLDLSQVFDDLDTDDDDTVSREEFVAGRPDDLSEEEANALFDEIAGEDSDSATEEQFTAGMQPPQAPSSGGAGGMASPEEIFAQLDTDGDDTVSLEEFVAGRPDDVSEEQATALFSSIAGEDADSITEEQFASAMPPPPPPMEQASQTATSDTSDTSDSNTTSDSSSTSSSTSSIALEQLLAAIEAYRSSSSNATTSVLGASISA